MNNVTVLGLETDEVKTRYNISP